MSAGSSFRPTQLLLPLCCVAATLPPQPAEPPQQAVPAVTSNTSPAIADAFARYRLVAANDPAEILARYLRTLATNPRDLEALTGAGRAALAIGDANAALAFYARAEEIAPRDGRIKAGIASALVRLEKPREAIRLFDDAVDLGVSEADVASDRGLAWDLRGDPKRAQKYYAVALQARDDDETVRRLALSTAISGDSVGAATLLDPLLRRNDPAAWRARAFVHAMSGDIGAAETVARSAMSSAQVAALRPFLVRLGTLRPAQKALAVHFGEMPAEGRSYSPAELAALDGPAARPGTSGPAVRPSTGRSADMLVPAGDAFGPRADSETAARPAERLSTAPRRRPGEGDAAGVAMVSPTKPLALAVATPPPRLSLIPHPTPQARPAPPLRATTPPQPTTVAPVTGPLTPTPAVVPAMLPPPPQVTPKPAAIIGPPAPPRVPAPVAIVKTAPVTLPPAIAASAPPAPAPAVTPPPAPIILGPVAAKPAPQPIAPVTFSLAPKPPRPNSLAAVEVAIAASVNAESKLTATPAIAPDKPAPSATKAKAEPEKKPKVEPDKKSEPARNAKAEPEKKAKPKSDEPKPAKQGGAAPERVWVQVAGGATKTDLPKAWAKLKGKAPSLGKGQSIATTPLRFTNRLLVGPFKSADDAQDYVNRMSKNGLSGFVFTSTKGQDVEKLPSGK